MIMKTKFSTFAALAVIAGLFSSSIATAAVTPALVSNTMEINTSMIVDKTVDTPPIPPKPDVIFLADTTGSMGPAIANVQAGASSIMSSVLAAQPDSQFGAASYKDFNCDAVPYNLEHAITPTTADVDTAIGTWSASGGCDTPEAQINALFELATNPAVGFRTGSTRIVVWFGDASGHDPSNGHTMAGAIAALTAAGVKVIAVPVASGFGDGIDATGQATAITSATSGVLVASADPSDVSAAILAGLSSLPVTVSWDASSCAPGLNVSLSPASQTVTSGSPASFTETIGVPNDPALMGTVQSCVVHFMDEHGNPLGDEKIEITIKDTIAPSASCTETNNPSGKNVPTAHKTNEDGFFILGGKDNVDPSIKIYVKDSVTGTVWGPFAAGTKIKYVEANGATPSQKPGAGDVDWMLKGQGDAIVYSVDASGNVSSDASCLVPPQPK